MTHRGGIFDGARLFVTGSWMRIATKRERDMATGSPIEWQIYEEHQGEMIHTQTVRKLPNQ